MEIGNLTAQSWLSAIDRNWLLTTHERSPVNRAMPASCGAFELFAMLLEFSSIRSGSQQCVNYCPDGRAFHGDSTGSNRIGIAEIKCMFWCMFASDVTAIYCDILQNRNDSHSFCSV
jgi:hypothetical protein